MEKESQLRYAIISKIGTRANNEDYVMAAEKQQQCCFVVCDGLGGHGLGDVASKLVTETIVDVFYEENVSEQFLSNAIDRAQAQLLEKQREMKIHNQMKTTVTALATDGENVYVGHVGDSRVYTFARNEVKMRTIDHSVPQMKVLFGEIAESEIRNHPQRNVILRAMGSEWGSPMYELSRPMRLKDCQAFLLCSDGFWELIEEDEMLNLLKQSENVQEWLDKMTIIVENNGKGRNMDNYTAIAVWNSKYENM